MPEQSYERFTDRARKVMQLANSQAYYLQHEHVGTEHILFGFAKEWNGVGANVLNNLGIQPETILAKFEVMVQKGPEPVQPDKKLLTPRALKVLEHAGNWAHNLHHNYIGTEHLLLGMLAETQGVASVILTQLWVKNKSRAGATLLNLEMVKDKIEKLLAPPDAKVPSESFVVDIAKVRKAVTINLAEKKGDNVEQLKMLLRELSGTPPEKEIVSLIFYIK